jgi:predicted nucleotidyltransferase
MQLGWIGWYTTLMEIAPGLRAILQELRARLERLYGDQLVGLLLYGSQARGGAEEGSDIDVLAVLKGSVEPCVEIRRTEFIVAELSLAHDVVISCVFTSEAEFESDRTPLLLNVHAEGLPV